MPTQHEAITNDPVNPELAYLHVHGFVGTNAERLAYPTASLPLSMTWYESDTKTEFQWNGTDWVQGGGGSGFLDSGFVTLGSGEATIHSSHCHAPGTVGYILTPQDLNTVGTPRIDPSTLVDGVSIGINSTGILDNGSVFWAIVPT